MSSNAYRHQFKPSVPVKQAFEENENRNTEEISDKNESSVHNIKRAFFTINDSTVEVILDKDILSWSSISGEKIHERKTINRENMNSIDLHYVYAITPIYHHRRGWVLNNNEKQWTMTVSTISSSSSSSNSRLRGFQLYSYKRMDDNILQEIHIIFQSNLDDQIERWYELLSKMISEYRPSRNILVICNPYAGSKSSRHVYNTKIKPMFERTQDNITYLEISDVSSVDEVLNDFQGDFHSLYGLVIMGGDGSVINVINALLRYLAKENRMRLDTENELPSLPFPICIVPIGTTNIICHSIHGNTDHCTPIFHLIFNQRMQIDMSAIFDINYNFVTANFSAGAGYPANALKYFTRYSLYNPKQIVQKSFAKAASNKNLKPIEMEIRYIPADQTNTNVTRCHQGCPTCIPTVAEENDNQVKVFDDGHVEKIDKRKKLLTSNNGSSNRLLLSSSRKMSDQQNKEEKQWRILHHNYLQVAVLTNANLWSFAPQGLSKFGHLADGLLDLILIEQTTRKDFLRSIKRNGNSKNQYDFSFTNLIKVKEIELEIKFRNDNLINQLDSTLPADSSNEEYSNNENKFSFILKPHRPNAPLSEERRRHHSNEQIQESSKVALQSSKSMDASLHNCNNRNQQEKHSEDELDSPSNACGGQFNDEKQNRRSTDGKLSSARSFFNLLIGGNSSSGKFEQSSTIKQEFSSVTTDNSSRRRSSMNSRLLSVENETTSTCMWNLDFTSYNSPLIRIKSFHRFLPVFGVGPNPDPVIKQVNYSCFGRIG